MKSFTINMNSMTQAEKARTFLARHGIRSRVERTVGRGGCSFSLRVYGERETVCPLLGQIGISCGLSR